MDKTINIVVDTKLPPEEDVETERKYSNYKGEPKVRVTSDGLWQNTHVMVGDQELRVNEMHITLGKNYMLQLELKVSMPSFNIEVLEENTKLTIVKE